MEELKLNGKVLKPIADLLEDKIQSLMTNVINENKTGEITLKIQLSTIDREGKSSIGIPTEWKEPIINYQLTEKLKEKKVVEKGGLGIGYKIEKDDFTDEIQILEVN